MPLAFDTDPGVNRLNAFVDENKYVFSSKDYDMSKGTFFLQIERTNTKPIIRQLKTIGDTLYIYAKDFESFTSAAEDKPKYTLGYYSKSTNTSQPIIQIAPYVDQTGEMTAIIKAVTAASKEKYKLLVEQEAYSEVYVSLGKPSDITFTLLFEKIYAGLPKKMK